MNARKAFFTIGLSPSILSLACASAFAALEQPPPRAAPEAAAMPAVLAVPSPLLREPRVVVADPRHPSIRIELPASEVPASGEAMANLYRKLVRSGAANAQTVVVENGRVFFRRADNTALAGIAPSPESPGAQPLVLKIAEHITPSEARPAAAKTATQAPARRPQVARAPLAPTVAIIEISATLPDLPEAEKSVEAEAPSLFAAPLVEPLIECAAVLLAREDVTAPPEMLQLRAAYIVSRQSAEPSLQPVVLDVLPTATHGIIALASLDQAGEWLVR